MKKDIKMAEMRGLKNIQHKDQAKIDLQKIYDFERALTENIPIVLK